MPVDNLLERLKAVGGCSTCNLWQKNNDYLTKEVYPERCHFYEIMPKVYREKYYIENNSMIPLDLLCRLMTRQIYDDGCRNHTALEEKMPVDKAFEEQRKRPPTEEAKKFADKYSNVYVNFHNTYQQALVFHDAFTAGQKSLSPEVREVLAQIESYIVRKEGDEYGWHSYICICCGDESRSVELMEHRPDCIVIKSKKLLAKE